MPEIPHRAATSRPLPIRRAHPSQRARAVALASSVAATLGVAAALTHADTTAASAASAAEGSTVVAQSAQPSTATGSGTGSTTTADGPYADGTYTGAAEWTRWGDVQVQVTIEGGRIVSTEEVQAPSDGRSRSINSQAQPILEAQAIAAQSADLDGVSGATYTSETYRTSLQSALDAAQAAA